MLLRFFFIIVLLLPLKSIATTFGPFPLVGQVENSPFVVRGFAINERVALDRRTEKPFTYWDFTVIEQMRGNPVGTPVVIRQPGGEVGEIGYRVSGSATLKKNEEVVLMLRGTQEANTYDVVGYSAGKYTVASGGATLENAAGFTAVDARGNKLSLEQFRDIIKRVNNNAYTQEDRQIIFNNGNERHQHQETNPTPFDSREAEQNSFSQEKNPEKKPLSIAESPQSNSEFTEESSKGHSIGWQLLLALGGVAVAGAWFIFKQR